GAMPGNDAVIRNLVRPEIETEEMAIGPGVADDLFALFQIGESMNPLPTDGGPQLLSFQGIAIELQTQEASDCLRVCRDSEARRIGLCTGDEGAIGQAHQDETAAAGQPQQRARLLRGWIVDEEVSSPSAGAAEDASLVV